MEKTMKRRKKRKRKRRKKMRNNEGSQIHIASSGEVAVVSFAVADEAQSDLPAQEVPPEPGASPANKGR